MNKNEPVTVSFSESFVQRDQDVADLGNPRPETRFCMMEIPKEELESLQQGATFRFQTHSAGGTALCTEKKTYQVEFLENSNSLFIGRPVMKTPATGRKSAATTASSDSTGAADETSGENGAEAKPEAKLEPPPQEWDCKLYGQVRGQFFLKPTNGDTTKIMDLVGVHKLTLSEAADVAASNEGATALTTAAALEYDVAASAAEIKTILKDGPYVELGGAWKMLTKEFTNEVLDTALAAVTANGWDKSAVNLQDLLASIQDHLGDAGTNSIPTVAVLRKVMECVLAVPKPETPEVAAKPGDSKDPKAAEAKTDKDGKDAKADKHKADCSAESAEPENKKSVDAQIDENIVALDVDKVSQFQAMQLLHTVPADVRRRFQLAAPAPKAKKARVGGPGAAVPIGRDAPLQLAEFVSCFREVSGLDMKGEDLLKMLGTRAHHDELEGCVQALDVLSLPQEPRTRLKRLFELQSHWRTEKLAELIAPTLGQVKVDPWLSKWARTVFVTLEGCKEEQRMLTRKFAGI